MNLVKGEGMVFPKAGKSFDPVLIPKAIRDAGFTPVSVTVVADGTLAIKNGTLELDVPDLTHPFRLADGSKTDALKKRADLVGRPVRITGEIEIGHPGRLWSLIVEDFQAVSKPSP